MRVEDRQLGGAGNVQAGRLQETARSQGSAASRSGAAPGEDRLEISGLAGLIRAGLDAAAATQRQRVESLARQYQAGGYRVDAAVLGARLAAQPPEM